MTGIELIASGWDIICKGCPYTEDCIKTSYWKNVSPAYAAMCGKCIDREEAQKENGVHP
jgi:hypothetical protein